MKINRRNFTKSRARDGMYGLYNMYGRSRTIFRRFLYKIFGKSVVMILDPILRNIKKGMPYNCKSIYDAGFNLLFHNSRFITGKLLKCF